MPRSSRRAFSVLTAPVHPVTLLPMTLAAALLDIPIHKSKIESLHVLFSLFVEFKNSQHFRSEEETLALTNVDVVAAAEPDVMVL